MKHSLRLSVVAIFLVAKLTWSAQKPEPEAVGGSSGSPVLSPTVVATFIIRTPPKGTPELELLVLWRGTPGWFMREGSSESSSSGVSLGPGESGIVVERLSYGGIQLDLEFERGKRIARIQGREIALDTANVILVDDVDGSAGPQVAGSLQVDPAVHDEPAGIEVIIRNNPELYLFLRCDARLPDATAQPMFDSICARMEPR
jgi:hypothetical protein